MATVLDAFVVTLGLDASQYQKQQKEATAAWGKTKDEVAKSGKAIEDQSKKVSAGFRDIALEALGMFAAFAGSSALKNFVQDLIATNTQLGYFSQRIGASPQVLTAWENAAKSVGGSADATAGSFQKVADALFNLHNNGENLPLAFYQLESWSETNIDTEHGPVAFMEGLATAAGKLNAAGNGTQAAMLLKNIGIDPGTINLMLKGGPALDAYIASLQKFSPTQEQIKASQDMASAWSLMQTAASSLGNAALPALDKALTPALTAMTAWLGNNKALIDSKIDEVVTAFANAINSVDWVEFTGGMNGFSTAADKVAAALNGIATAIKWLRQLNEDSKSWLPTRILNGLAGIGADPNKGDGLDDSGTRNVPDSIGPGPLPGRASGGGVDAGGTYRVGERGPEILRLGGSGGSISPNNGLGGDLQVDGRTVNRTNPVPVRIASLGDSSGGENWLQTAIKGIGGFFGGGGGGGGGVANTLGDGVANLLDGGNSPSLAPGAPGQYRPVYKLGAHDLSDKLVNVIAGEATTSQLSTDAVINNMFNRLGTHTYGPSGNLEEVALARGQYAASPNHRASAARAAFIRARIEAIASGAVPDPTHGSNEYRAAGYMGPWGRAHRNSPVYGGNRFAYNPKGGHGPYSSYDHPNIAFSGGAAFAASYGHGGGKSSSGTVNINGPINVHTQATDAKGIARDLSGHLKSNTLAAIANYGLK